MTPRPQPGEPIPETTALAEHTAAAALTLAVAVIIAVGFLGSYGPLRDAFLAIHQGSGAAARDPWAVDGLIAVAVAAAIWLRHETAARRYALTVAAVTTSASLLLNFLHGEGVIQPGGRTAQPLHPALVFTIASLPVAAVGFGSHLLVACLRQLGSPARATRTAAVPSRPARTTTRPSVRDGTAADTASPSRTPASAETGTARRTRTASEVRPRPPVGTTTVAEESGLEAVRAEADAVGPDIQDGEAGRDRPDPALITRGRQALADLAADGVPPSRDTLRARMCVGNRKASAVWTVLQKDGTVEVRDGAKDANCATSVPSSINGHARPDTG